MPWQTPTLKEVRKTTRDFVSAGLLGAPMIPNSVLRVMSDANAGLAHLTLLYIDWLSKQLLPDSAETEWLDRHANIWLTNADGSRGRKPASFAFGSILVTGTSGSIIPQYTQFGGISSKVSYETTEQVILGTAPTEIPVRALDAGVAGNLDPDTPLGFLVAFAGVDATASVVNLEGGADAENDDDLRARVLERIQNPPMGGDAEDYIRWALEFPGVTRAWSYPLEMGIGTVSVRFVMDDLRITDNGIPGPDDVAALKAYLDTKRPVAIKDFFVVAPIPFLVSYNIRNLETLTESTKAAIEKSLRSMYHDRAKPGQTIWKSWASEAISAAAGEDHHDLDGDDAIMPAPGYMPILGDITYSG